MKNKIKKYTIQQIQELDMSPRKNLIIIENDLSKQEISLEKLRIEINEIYKQTEDKYYSQNVILDSVLSRTFYDLVRICISRIKNKVDTKTNNVLHVHRYGK